MNEIHMYRDRHLFRGDYHIGSFANDPPTVTLKTAHQDAEAAVRAFFGSRFGHVPNIVVSDVEPVPPLRLLALPPRILALVDPALGDRTPEVKNWILANHSAEQIAARYGSEEAAKPEKKKK